MGPNDPWTFAVSLAGFSLLVIQLHADHSRRRKQATVDFYQQTLERRHSMQVELPSDQDGAAIGEYLEPILNHGQAREAHQRRRHIQQYLGYWELLAAAANADVLDAKLLTRIASSHISDIRSGYSPYIEWARKESGQDSLYRELTSLVDERFPLYALKPLQRTWHRVVRRNCH